jgi:hypothetical protein
MTQKHSEQIKEAVAADLRRDFWYKAGEATFNPSLPDVRGPRAVEDHILTGWMPAESFINPGTRVTFIGCCFGSSLLNHLKTLDYGERAVSILSSCRFPKPFRRPSPCGRCSNGGLRA